MAYSQFPDQVGALDAYTNGVRYRATGDDYAPAKHGLYAMKALHALNGRALTENLGIYRRIISANRDDDAVVGVALHAMVDAVFHSHAVVGKDGVTRMMTYEAPEGHGLLGSYPDFIGEKQIKLAGGAVIEALQTVTGRVLSQNQRTGAMNFVLNALSQARDMTLQQGYEQSLDGPGHTEQNFRSVASRILGGTTNMQLLQPNSIQLPFKADPNTRDLVIDQTQQFLNSGNAKVTREFADDFATTGMCAAAKVMNNYRNLTGENNFSTSPDDLMDTKNWSPATWFSPAPYSRAWPCETTQSLVDPVPGFVSPNGPPGYQPQLPPNLRIF